MKILSALCGLMAAFFFVGGITLLFDMNAAVLYQKLFQKGEKKQTLKEKLDVLQGRPPRGFFKREMYNVRQLLEEMGKAERYRNIQIISGALAVFGVLLALLFRNLFLLPVFVVLFGAAPFLYIKVQAQKYKKAINDALETTVSLITTSYLRSDNLLGAVEENLEYLHPSVQPFFKGFCVEATRINANLVTCINSLKLKINHPIFHEWCSGLIMCQNDSSLRKGLLPIIRKFSDTRTVQTELDAEMYGPKREQTMMTVIVLLLPFFLYLLNKEWGKVLFTTTAGKLALAAVLVITLGLFVKTRFFTKPMQFRGGDSK